MQTRSKALGGRAVANHESVATMNGRAEHRPDGARSFGRVDIVVHNAGILRDRMIFNMTEEEWDAVIDTHLKGCFAVTRAAAPHMREQKWGRFINMTSTSGLVGNVGQANYAAAKLGIVGLHEGHGARHGALQRHRQLHLALRVDAHDRHHPDRDGRRRRRASRRSRRWGPSTSRRVAVFLASDAAKEVSGQVFGVRGKELMLFSHMRPVREHPRRRAGRRSGSPRCSPARCGTIWRRSRRRGSSSTTTRWCDPPSRAGRPASAERGR